MEKNIVFKKVLMQLVAIYLLILFSTSFWSCKDEPTAPQKPDLDVGLTGIVYDTSGHRLDSVRVYCMFQFDYYPVPSTGGTSHLTRVSKPDTFGFNLYQNFPNPVRDSTFIRFSLPDSCSTEFTITDWFSESIKYSRFDNLPDGLYQIYIRNLVDSLQLHNGTYRYTLKAKSKTGTLYTDTKKMFILSDLGEPNSTTGVDGSFFFNYKYTFVDDTVAINRVETFSMYYQRLGRVVNLLFERRGYYPEVKGATLNPYIRFTSDVIMMRRNDQ